jgi:pimeloyl-ACP methyl ester carboxylesterase
MRFSTHTGDRVLNGWVGGADHGAALVFHTGTPSPPVRWASLDDAARDHNLRLITYARPGYSGSSRHPGRSVADAATDTVAVLDELGVGPFMVLGHSGGGPHALACAALISDRCQAAVSLAGVAPFEAEDLDWMAGMAEENVEEFTTVLKGEETLRPYLLAYAEHFSQVSSEDVEASLAGLLSDVDRAALTEELSEMMARSLRQAAEDGVEGWIEDDLAFAKSWGFDLSSIEASWRLARTPRSDGSVCARRVAPVQHQDIQIAASRRRGPHLAAHASDRRHNHRLGRTGRECQTVGDCTETGTPA